MKLTRFADIPKLTSVGNYHVNMSIKYLVEHVLGDWVEEQGLNLDPDFQRPHIWTRKDQTNFIEFILKGGLSGRDLYFNHPYWMNWKQEGEFVVVDGKQRLEACRAFIHNEIRVFGSYYAEYEDRMPSMDTTLIVHVNDLKKKSEVLKWYLELNEGGIAHTRNEIKKVKELYALQLQIEKDCFI